MNNKFLKYIVISSIFILATTIIGCQNQSPQCVKMRDCCKQLNGEPGVGRSCSPTVLSHVDKPETCLAVLQSVDAMFETKGKELPEVCRLSANQK